MYLRAVDNQVYVATASPARDEGASYVAWGHSTVVNPWYAALVSPDLLCRCAATCVNVPSSFLATGDKSEARKT